MAFAIKQNVQKLQPHTWLVLQLDDATEACLAVDCAQ